MNPRQPGSNASAPALPREGESRVALVTGAGHRVGRAIALALGRRGLRVAVHYNHAAADAEETLRDLTAIGCAAALFPADLTVADAPAQLIQDVVRAWGRLDVVVNSAAVMRRTPIESVTPAEWDAIMALNVRAPFFVSQAAAPHLRRSHEATGKAAVIANIADLAAFETWPGYVPHGISKSGVVTMTRALANVFAPEIRVVGIAPGTVLLPEGWSAEGAEHLMATTPLKRLGDPSDVTSTLLFLLDADYITGETVIVDGGRHIRR